MRDEFNKLSSVERQQTRARGRASVGRRRRNEHIDESFFAQLTAVHGPARTGSVFVTRSVVPASGEYPNNPADELGGEEELHIWTSMLC